MSLQKIAQESFVDELNKIASTVKPIKGFFRSTIEANAQKRLNQTDVLFNKVKDRKESLPLIKKLFSKRDEQLTDRLWKIKDYRKALVEKGGLGERRITRSGL